MRVEDGPTGGDERRYPGVDGRVEYGEGTLLGYRHYETAGVTPAFCFGHGLSYGDIVFDEVVVTAERLSVRLVNKGERSGTEVVQVYVRALDARVPRADRELAGFAKVQVPAGQAVTTEVELGAAAYRYWDVDAHDWRSDPGRYEILVGASSRDIRASSVIEWRPA